MTNDSENPFDQAFACENNWTIHVQKQQLRARILQSGKGTEDVLVATSKMSKFSAPIFQHGLSPPNPEVLSPRELGARASSQDLCNKSELIYNETTDFASMWRNDIEMTPPGDFQINQYTHTPHDSLLPSAQVLPYSPRIKKRRRSTSPVEKGASKNSVQPQSVAVSATAIPHVSATARTTDEMKRAKFLERNRTSAVKCRERRKTWVEDLAKRAVELESSNHLHTITISALNSEKSFLKKEVLKHARRGPDGVSINSAGNNDTNDSTSVEQDP
ncbi:Alcohol O-acetyltransferase [Xylographa soralifera]|nr:Alcohol O-acetyltransferase [Xylographa soralifera]